MSTESEILKQIDNLIIKTELITLQSSIDEIDFFLKLDKFYTEVKNIMKNYEKVLEVNHFKQTEL